MCVEKRSSKGGGGAMQAGKMCQSSVRYSSGSKVEKARLKNPAIQEECRKAKCVNFKKGGGSVKTFITACRYWASSGAAAAPAPPRWLHQTRSSVPSANSQKNSRRLPIHTWKKLRIQFYRAQFSTQTNLCQCRALHVFHGSQLLGQLLSLFWTYRLLLVLRQLLHRRRIIP